MNINESSINVSNPIDANLIELYTKAQNFPVNKQTLKTKVGKIVKTTRNNQLMDKLSVRRKGGNINDHNITFEEGKHKKSNERKQQLETLPHDLTTAISLGQKMITKFNKRSRMKGNNLFTSSTTPTGNAKNSLKTTINNSMNQGVFKVNKSFLNKLSKMKN